MSWLKPEMKVLCSPFLVRFATFFFLEATKLPLLPVFKLLIMFRVLRQVRGLSTEFTLTNSLAAWFGGERGWVYTSCSQSSERQSQSPKRTLTLYVSGSERQLPGVASLLPGSERAIFP